MRRLVTLVVCTAVGGLGYAASVPLERLPQIFPDYRGITVPPNMAPLNFRVQEPGRAFRLQIRAPQGPSMAVSSRSGLMTIPPRPWRLLLQQNRGQTMVWEISVRDANGLWSTFTPIENGIAQEPINSHLVYRRMQPLYQSWDQMGLYQRDLTTYSEKPLVVNRAMGHNCMNCHSFQNYRPDRMIFHMRAGEIGTFMMQVYDGKVSKIDTRTEFNPALAYRCWHPNGELVAFSHNAVKQVFHAVGDNRDVYDRTSDMVLYNIKTHTMTTSPKICDPNVMETYPEWSVDGRYLYFCSTPGLQRYGSEEHPYQKIRYDLQRIAFDVNDGTWGDVETVFAASAQGLSVAHPKVSPNGRWLLFCASEYGNFPLYNRDGDLYVLDLDTRAVRPVDVLNSPQSESYHCFSSNSRWVVFSSKRLDKLCTHPYFSYVDQAGRFSKPFILPQKDPRVYQDSIAIYNVPELVNGPIEIRPQTLLSEAWSGEVIQATFDTGDTAPSP